MDIANVPPFFVRYIPFTREYGGDEKGVEQTMQHQRVLVLDFGGQYNQLIARRVREQGVYCDLLPYDIGIERIREYAPIGIIFTGGPNSVYGEDSPTCSREIYELGIPILGICYGSQLMAHMNGGTVTTAPVSEYGKTEVEVDNSSVLFEGVSERTICWMSHSLGLTCPESPFLWIF